MSPEPSTNEKPSGTLTISDGNGIIESKQLICVAGHWIVPDQSEEKQPEETMHPDGRPHVFLRDGTSNPEFKKWQHQHLHFASPEVCAFSGIDDSVPAAIDKLILKNRDESFRQVACRLNMLLAVPFNVRIYVEKNGRGSTYYRVRYELSHPRGQSRQQMSIYLGTDPRIAKWAEEILFERFGVKTDERSKINIQKIQVLKMVFRRVRHVANEIAKKAGYWFNGYYLVERYND